MHQSHLLVTTTSAFIGNSFFKLAQSEHAAASMIMSLSIQNMSSLDAMTYRLAAKRLEI